MRVETVVLVHRIGGDEGISHFQLVILVGLDCSIISSTL